MCRCGFHTARAAEQPYAQPFAQIDNLDHLLALVDQLLILQERTAFDATLRTYLPTAEGRG